jgi:hypothetical protein
MSGQKEYTEAEVRLIIKGAIAAEREACAKLCEELALPDWPNKIRQPLATAIRARGNSAA